MKRVEQRAAIDAAFTEALAHYQSARSGEFDETKRHDGAVALGKLLQTVSLGLRLELVDYDEYETYMARLA